MHAGALSKIASHFMSLQDLDYVVIFGIANGRSHERDPLVRRVAFSSCSLSLFLISIVGTRNDLSLSVTTRSSGWLYPTGSLAQRQFLFMKKTGALKCVMMPCLLPNSSTCRFSMRVLWIA